MLAIKKYIFLSIIICVLSSCSSVNEKKILVKEVHLETYKIINDSASVKQLVRSLFVAASVAEMQGRYSDAIVDYMHAAKYDSSAVIYFAISKCYYNINKPDMAIENGIKSFNINPDFVPNLELLSDLYSITQDYKSGLAISEKLVTLSPNIETRKNYAKNLETNNIPKAIEEYKIIYKETNDVESLIKLNSLYLMTRDTAGYKENIKIISELPEQSKTTLLSLIYGCAILKDYSDFSKIIQIADQSLLSYDFVEFFNLSLELYTNDTSESIKKYAPEILKIIDEKDIDHWKTPYLGAFIAERIKDTIRMDRYYSRTIQLNDSIDNLPLQAASANFRLNRLEKAIYYLELKKDKYSDNYIFPLYLSFAYLDLKKYDKALENAKSAYLSNSHNFQTVFQVAIVYERLDIRDSVKKYYELAYPLNTAHVMLNNNYAYILSELNIELDKAEKMSAFSLEKEPNNSSFLDTYGWIQFKLGNVEKAYEFINKANQISKDAPDILEHLGDIYFYKKDKEKAKLYWEKSLNLNPSNKALSEKILKSK